MIKNMKWILIALVILAGLYLLNRINQSRFTTKSDRLFPADTNGITRFVIESRSNQITLDKYGENWTIVGNDSLIVREARITDFFDKVLNAKRETMVSQNENKWNKYSVGDSTGTQLILYNDKGKIIADVILGRSKSDWSHNYVRIADSPKVYLTDNNIIHILNTSDTYWGEKPKPIEPDTTAADTLNL